ncbi:hypothetical protein [Nannocystis radixulma]|uniref:Uncharacterized protein n=1 Tax=Nannocystis radixulma TaxID=2995305 RepID=A0ABT5B6U4_9BACT|nr:hypothetical protein [Nannocystis radixulma]MDC0669838.1 hypothetical protein [Nannocystis radixulma]
MNVQTFGALQPAVLGASLVLSLACGPEWPDEGTDSNSGSGGTESTTGVEEPTGGEVPPPIERDACGQNVQEGWVTRCWNDNSFLRIGKDSNEQNAETIEEVVSSSNTEFARTCCEGLALDETANTSCEALCQHRACEAARINHLEFAENTPGIHFCENAQTCGFDMELCLQGTWHQQTIQFQTQSWSYFLRAGCEGVKSNEQVDEDGHFLWREKPEDDPANNPAMCSGSPNQLSDPQTVVGDDVAVQASGTTAMVAWAIGGASGVASASNATVDLSYNIHACDGGRCMALSNLHVGLPSTTVQGIAVENAHLVVYQVDTKPILQTTGSYAYAPGTIHAMLSAVAGLVPFSLRRSNVGAVQVQLSPGSDTLVLSGLKFDYTDSVLDAELQVDIVGDYTRRGPTAVIVPANVPIACDEPVTFRAASSDLDRQSLSHLWWVPNALVATSSTIDVVLPNGPHMIALVTKDPDGRLDATAITYTRTCR